MLDRSCSILDILGKIRRELVRHFVVHHEILKVINQVNALLKRSIPGDVLLGWFRHTMYCGNNDLFL